MTLQLAVRITGDASSLRDATAEATAAVTPMVNAIETANSRATALAGATDRAAAATTAMGAAQGRAAGQIATAASATSSAMSAVSASAGAVTVSQGQAATATAAATSALAAGATAARAAAGAHAQAASATAAATGALTAAANSNSLRPDQWKNLSFQINDVVTSLGSGAPVMQVLAQQGGQVMQVLQDAPGGVGGALRIIGARALGLLSPFALAAGGALAFGGAVLYAGTRWAATQEQIERGLLGIGRMSGVTASGIERIASATAAASGNRFTTGDARDAAIAAASTGKIGAGNIGGVVGLVPGFAQLTGLSSSDAAGELARIFSDPIKGAEELNAKLGILDYTTLHYIQTLAAQGDRQGAIRELTRAVQPELARAAELTSTWAKAWNAVKGAAGDAADAVGRALSKGSIQEQAAAAERARRAAVPESTATAEQSPLLNNPFTARGSQARDRADGVTANAEQLNEVARRASQAAYAEARSSAANERSIRAGGDIRSLIPEIGQLEEFQNKLKELQSTLADPQAVGKLGPLGEDLPRAIDMARGAVETFITTEERQRRSEDLTIRSILARTDAERGAIAAERERLSLAGQAISEDDRRQRIEAARTAVLAQSKRDSEDRLRSANDNAASAGLLPYQRQIADLEAKYREIFKGSTGNPAALANDRAAKAAERQAIDAGAIDAPIRDVLMRVGDQSRALQVQRDSLFASSEAAATMAAKQDLISDALRRGIDPVEAYRGRVDQLAAALGRSSAANDEFQRAKAKIVGGMDELRSGSRGLLTGIFSDTRQGKNPLDGIMSSLGGMADKIFERTVSAPLTESLLGQDGKAGGGLLDGISGIFGSKSSLATANITAANVNLTGSITGLPGLGGTPGSGSPIDGAVSAVKGAMPGGASATGQGLVDKASSLVGLTESRDAGALNTFMKTNGVNLDVASDAWCAGFVNANLKSLGIGGSGSNVATSFLGWGSKVQDLSKVLPGDVLVEARGLSQGQTGGHVGIATGATKTGSDGDLKLEMISGNSSNAVRRTWESASEISARRGSLEGLDSSLKDVSTSATDAAKGAGDLTSGLDTLPGSLTQASQGVDQLGNSLGSSGGGGGLLGSLGKLLGLGGGGSFADLGNGAVMVAGGGHVRGPGTSTSDSIPARLSDGEFVVNAAAASRNLDVLHAINNNRMPAFAEGGRVTPLPSMRGSRSSSSGGSIAGGDTAGGPVVNIYNQESGRVEATASRGPKGSTDIMIRSLDQALAKRAGNGQSALARTYQSGAGMLKG